MIISPESIERYESVFRLLLTVKRCRMALETSRRGIQQTETHRKLCVLKMKLMFFIVRCHFIFKTRFQSYLMDSVIASESRYFESKISQESRVNELRKAHDAFTKRLVDYSFLNVRVI